ncbi:MAG TPA: 2'-5' RNA ligase family protein, partial [Actinomycetes bacterium]|nr:2'-5' RNA ligase family protein [Actinomycetes bacterium]
MTEWAFCPHGADLSVPVDPLVRTIGVAIPIPEPWGDVLQERRADYGDGQAWTIPTHVTLLPPTQISQARLSAVDDHLRSVSQSETAFEIELGGAQTFRPTTPTVFLSLSTGGDDCSRLETQIRTGPLRRRLLFPYQPHVTLAFDVPDETLDR